MTRPILAARLACWVALPLLGAPAQAQVAFPSRTSSTLIHTAAKDFSDATATITATTQVAPGSTGSRDIDFGTSPAIASLTTSTTGDVAAGASIVDVEPDYGYAEAAGSVTATGPKGGSFTLTESYGHTDGPDGFGPLYRYADSSLFASLPSDYGLPAFTRADLPVLEVYLPLFGADLVDQGGSFVAELLMPGDYSATGGLGSGTGQHYLALLNPAWTITQDFTYDGTTGLTTFRAERSPFDYADEGPRGLRLDAFFFGAPAIAAAVPEPATWAAMLLGLGMIGGLLRSRRRNRPLSRPALIQPRPLSAWGRLALADE